MKQNLFAEGAAGLLILLFVYTAGSKLAGLPQFHSVLSVSPLIGGFAAMIAWVLPLAELLVALLLFLPQWRLQGFFASFFLLLVFTLYLVAMLLLSPELPCSCGGVLSALTWRQHVMFNLFFLAIAFAGIRLERWQSAFALDTARPSG